MAHVTLTDGRELDVEDGNTPLLDYYRGEGAKVEGVAEADPFPHVFVDGERVYPATEDSTDAAPVVETVDALDESLGDTALAPSEPDAPDAPSWRS